MASAADLESLRPTTVDDLCQFVLQVQELRRDLAAEILQTDRVVSLSGNGGDRLHSALRVFERLVQSSNGENSTCTLEGNGGQPMKVHIEDEVRGLKKDVSFLDELHATSTFSNVLQSIACVIPRFHSSEFSEDVDRCKSFVALLNSEISPAKPLVWLTDWDGTMKDYCAQYATNLQPLYSALTMAAFARQNSASLAAVLTAGPLRGPGILDLTALPLSGPVIFTGSWGRECWLNGERLLYTDGISTESEQALYRVYEKVTFLLHSPKFAKFWLVGSGVQRKVDRLTLGRQTVSGQVSDAESAEYTEAIRVIVGEVDARNELLHFDESSTKFEVEVVARHADSEEGTWHKGLGVERALHWTQTDLSGAHRVLISGDTASDLPMLEAVVSRNPEAVRALFVGAGRSLQERVTALVKDPAKCCFVSTPDAVHVAFAQLLAGDR